MTVTTPEIFRFVLIELFAPILILLPLGHGFTVAFVAAVEAWKKKEKQKVYFLGWGMLVGIYFFIEILSKSFL